MTTYPDQYRLHRGMTGWWQTCEAIGEHQGGARIKDDAHGRWEEWTCCAEREFVGDLLDCDICLEAGILPQGKDMPDGWIEDSQGFHCPKCQVPGRKD